MSKQQQAPGELELVREFVNTVDLERDEERLSSADALAAWLVDHGLAPPAVHARAADLRRAIELREALRNVLLAHNGGGQAPAAAYETLDDAVCRARVRLRFREGQDAAAGLESEAAGVDGALGRILVIVHGAIAQGTWTRLKACRDHSCEWAFYDHTKNRSGAWCSMRVCGNRAKARAYRERTHKPTVADRSGVLAERSAADASSAEPSRASSGVRAPLI
ncbi:MAG TPA: CGNR zinc finger domain-containing protein [Solirubrobacteraceae bacterium]|nr:CGNR zinc finger domain-containing protein [Solirubrobacteraceae bacterium]